jgi:branched-chain amino acid transport system substrate-binding protein
MRKLNFAAFAAAAALGVAAPASAQDITIAVIGPITGQYASFGEQMKRGAEMAVADLNAKGGVLGKKVNLVVEDDACDPKQAVAAATKVSDMKVAVVIGHFCSGSSIPASAVYARKGILQITPASTNPALTEDAARKGWKNVNRICGRDDAQGKVAGDYLAAHYKNKKIAILHDNTPYGKGLADETRKNLRRHHIKEAIYEAYKPGEKDYTALMGKLKARGIDVIYIGGYDAEESLMIRQAHEMGYTPQLLSGDALVTDNFWKVAGKAGEGVMMTFQPDPRDLPSAKEVVAKFKAQHYDPEGYTLYTYAAVQAWADAAARAKSIAMKKVSASLRSGHVYNTVIGQISLDKKGDVKNPKYVWFKWHDGKYAEVK